jgi:hypothetical protein
LHKDIINKGEEMKLNQSPKYVRGYQLFGSVQMPAYAKDSFSTRARWTAGRYPQA